MSQRISDQAEVREGWPGLIDRCLEIGRIEPGECLAGGHCLADGHVDFA